MSFLKSEYVLTSTDFLPASIQMTVTRAIRDAGSSTGQATIGTLKVFEVPLLMD